MSTCVYNGTLPPLKLRLFVAKYNVQTCIFASFGHKVSRVHGCASLFVKARGALGRLTLKFRLKVEIRYYVVYWFGL